MHDPVFSHSIIRLITHTTEFPHSRRSWLKGRLAVIHATHNVGQSSALHPFFADSLDDRKEAVHFLIGTDAYPQKIVDFGLIKIAYENPLIP